MEPLRDRFSKGTEDSARVYSASIPFDRRLYREDIRGSIAHARMLGKQGIISEKDAELIIMGLVSIREEIEAGEFIFKDELEDIHMNIEARLTEKIGSVGGKLHTARSRNDQVALDMRLFLKEAINNLVAGISGLQEALLQQATVNKDIVIPGYTHLQRAQPVLLAHHLLAYFEMLQRDKGRFRDCMRRTDVMPLGSGAVAGVSYRIDRKFLADELGFSRISENSMDAVGDRDFIIEFQSCASIIMMHISRLAEELVLWSSAEFSFIEIDDAYATSSSIMPQKKNPDMAELGRGKTGRVYGNLMGILTVMKGLPMAYNRDLQEDKEGLFDTVDTLEMTLKVFTGMINTIKINGEKTRAAVAEDYMLATDLADYLVKKGLPFRQAHSAVAALVRYALEQSRQLNQLTIEQYKTFSNLFGEDVFDITVDQSLVNRNIEGGTGPEQVSLALEKAKKRLKESG
ncbi:MAG: argininosuccinate lyase [Dehalococcoidia bacterium]|nr:argininosuccinate lyase [Dehalococcoidia bacterium]